MTLDDALRDIVSEDFAARLAIASDLRLFLRIASKQGSVKTVLQAMNSDDNRGRVLVQLLHLLRLDVDYRYESPWDTAIAVLLWIVARGAPQFRVLAAQAALCASQCWWAPMIAEELLLDPGAGKQTTDLERPQHTPTQLATPDTEDTYLRHILAWQILANMDAHPYAHFSVRSDSNWQLLGEKTLLSLATAKAQLEWAGPIAASLTHA
jgi:hypothetical protein